MDSPAAYRATIFCFSEILSLAWETKLDRLVHSDELSLFIFFFKKNTTFKLTKVQHTK
jgi:hypothetical protein